MSQAGTLIGAANLSPEKQGLPLLRQLDKRCGRPASRKEVEGLRVFGSGSGDSAAAVPKSPNP